MRRIRFSVPRAIVGNMTDVADIEADEDPVEGVVQTMMHDLSTEIELTIGGVTMHLAAWQDPDHWATDWREKCGDQDPGEFVAGLLAQAEEG